MNQLRMKLACLTTVFLDERVSYTKSKTFELNNYCRNYLSSNACEQKLVAVSDSSTVVEVCRTAKAYVSCQSNNCIQRQQDFYTLASDIQNSWACYNLSADMKTLISEAAEMRAACQLSNTNPCSSEDGAVSNARNNNMLCLALKVFTSCVERNCKDKDLNYDKINTVKNNPTCNRAAAIGTPALLLLLLVGTRYAV